MKKLVALLSLSLLFGLLWIFKEDMPQKSTSRFSPNLSLSNKINIKVPYKQKNSLPKALNLNQIPTTCLNKIKSKKLTHILENKSISMTQVFTNWHVKTKKGEIFRIRVFREDNSKGSYRKLVLYKEDRTGFPRMIKIPDEEQRRPTPEIINRYLNKGEIIYKEEGIEASNLPQADIYIEKENGEITRIDISTLKNQVDCRTD